MTNGNAIWGWIVVVLIAVICMFLTCNQQHFFGEGKSVTTIYRHDPEAVTQSQLRFTEKHIHARIDATNSRVDRIDEQVKEVKDTQLKLGKLETYRGADGKLMWKYTYARK